MDSIPTTRIGEAELCRRLLPIVRLAARRRGVRSEDLDDVAQEVLGRTLLAVRDERIDDLARVGAYAAGICRHVVADRARVAVRRARAWEPFAATIETTIETGVAADHEACGGARLQLEDCLGELSFRAREVVRRTYFDEADGPTIAKALDTSEGNVRVLRHRALQALRDCMQRGGA